MQNLTSKMQETAKHLLQSGEVTAVIGWEKGTFWYQSTPVMITDANDVEKLVWDEFCQPNLSKYLLDYKYNDGKIAIFVKGCDSRAFNRLLQDNQIKREKAYLIGLPCEGMKDHKKAALMDESAQSEVPLAKVCGSCRYPNAVVFDEFLGERTTPKATENDFSDVLALEEMTNDERYQFWQKEHTKCIRCYACRNACPACNCRNCIFTDSKSGWISKDVNASENQFYAITRATHVAGRCVECGQCEMVCPSDIPIMLMNKKYMKDINELFGAYDAGVDLEAPAPLGSYKLDDPEEFM